MTISESFLVKSHSFYVPVILPRCAVAVTRIGSDVQSLILGGKFASSLVVLMMHLS